MANQLPITPNTTCDIYRNGNMPPGNPDVAGVKIFLTPDFARDHDKAIQQQTYLRWTHVALMPLNTDVRDDYMPTENLTGLTSPAAFDHCYVPDKNGTKFAVVFVQRLNRGSTADCLQVYLQRGKPAWPTQNL